MSRHRKDRQSSKVRRACTLGSLSFLTLAILPLASASAVATDHAAGKLSAGMATGNYIFVMKETFLGDIEARGKSLATSHGAKLIGVFDQALHGFSLETSAREAEKILRSSSDIAFIEPDLAVAVKDNVTPVQPAAAGGSRQVIPWGVARVGACARGTCDLPSDVANARVWIIDSGISPHPDLNIDWNLAFSAVGEGGVDRLGHGTHVAGTVAAINNGFGVVGVAPGAFLVPVQVIDHSGGGSISTIIAGVEYVASQRKRCRQTIGCEPQKWVANMSLTTARSRALDVAVLRASTAGVRFAIAAGNFTRPAVEYSPGHLQRSNILTVSASCGPASPQCGNGKDSITSFSNYGNPPIDVAAPGDEVLSTYLGGTYANGHGTSMASPHVAGLLARLPELTTANLRTHVCGRLTTDYDRHPDRIAFAYGPDSLFCKNIMSQTPEPPPAVH